MTMNGKIVMVTGANSGIGKATALGLAKQGAAVVMVSRDRGRGEAARKEVAELSGNGDIELLTADFSSLEDVRELARKFRERFGKLHVLVNNAGGMFSKRESSKDGFEMTFAVNYLAPFLLTHSLLDTLKASAPSRIVNVASQVQAKTINADTALNPPAYKAFAAYGEAKLAVIMMTYTLAKRLQGSAVTINALHPGAVYTPQSAKFAPAPLRPLMRLFMKTPEQGAQTSLFLASSPEMEGRTGKYYKDLQIKQTGAASYDIALQERLYAKSLEWTGAERP
ncbi:SDR family oxidoreductase [Paenibacillus sp. MBLB4367]|uniref:SDR family oxidoreductase n=1 Tax=Paenibacillus sp. MBLB4367 TaxID=3384767 RepID=UPI00390816F1